VSVCAVEVLNAIPDQDTFYDVSDALEEQGLEKVIGRYRSKGKGVERDLLDQFQLYEAMLRHEDGVADSAAELSGRGMDNVRLIDDWFVDWLAGWFWGRTTSDTQ